MIQSPEQPRCCRCQYKFDVLIADGLPHKANPGPSYQVYYEDRGPYCLCCWEDIEATVVNVQNYTREDQIERAKKYEWGKGMFSISSLKS